MEAEQDRVVSLPAEGGPSAERMCVEDRRQSGLECSERGR
jgi:hypothetical protein